MNCEAALRLALLASPSFTDLVAERLFPLAAPQRTERPYVTYQVADEDPRNDSSPFRGERLTRQSLVYTIVADDYDTAEAVSVAIREVLDKYKADEPIVIRGAFETGRRTFYESPQAGAGMGWFGEQVDFDVWFKR